MKKLSLILLLAIAANATVQTAPSDFSVTLNNQVEQEITPEVKSWVAEHKTLVRSLVAATVVVALGGAATGAYVAYKKNEKFQKFVDSATASTCDFSKKAATKTGDVLKTAGKKTKDGFNASTEYIKNHKAITAIVATVLTAVAGLAIDKAVREDESLYNAIIDAVIDQFTGKTETKTAPAAETQAK
ncbi:MAG: hypothetical protein ABH827_02565 [bacterium]